MRENGKPVQIIREPQQSSAALYIFGDIVNDQWFEEETSPTSFRKEIEALAAQGVNEINVHVDSYGGSVSAAWAIYNVLKDFPGTVNSFADGFVASAAVYPFLAGKRRAANPMSAFFLHQAWISAAGNADELRKTADMIEKFNGIGLEAFADAGIDKERVLQLEKAETWLSAAEAYDLGLATEIIDRKDETPAQQSVRLKIVQALTAKDALTVNERRAMLGLEPIREEDRQSAELSEGTEGAQQAGVRGEAAGEEAGKAETGGREKSALRSFLGL
jgi:ATP-dependent protease ClpP protease subunit